MDYDKIFEVDNSDNEADENEEGEREEDAANTSSKKAQTRRDGSDAQLEASDEDEGSLIYKRSVDEEDDQI